MPMLSTLDAFCLILSTNCGISSIIILFINEQSNRELKQLGHDHTASDRAWIQTKWATPYTITSEGYPIMCHNMKLVEIILGSCYFLKPKLFGIMLFYSLSLLPVSNGKNVLFNFGFLS